MKDLTKGSFSQKEFTWFTNPDPSLQIHFPEDTVEALEDSHIL